MFCQGLGRLSLNRVRAVCFAVRAKSGTLPSTTRSSSSLPAQQQPSARLPFEVDTNVAKHTEIFRFDNFRQFAAVRIFAVTQAFMWAYMANFCYSVTDPANVQENQEQAGRMGGFLALLRQRLTTDRYRYGLTAMCAVFGVVVVGAATVFTRRYVRSVVLLKGGQRAFVQTYTPFRDLRGFEVPLEDINCLQSRLQKSNYISLKIRGHWFHYMLDQRGIFPYPQLFDHTVGLSRKLK